MSQYYKEQNNILYLSLKELIDLVRAITKGHVFFHQGRMIKDSFHLSHNPEEKTSLLPLVSV
jgi:hypothetical protein